MTEFEKYLQSALKEITFVAEDTADQPPNYNIDSEIRELIIQERLRMGLTQKELAKRAQITQANLSKIENGNQRPSIMVLDRIARSLGLRLVVDFAEPREVD